MRVVIDTNVFVSGVFWKGPPSTILEAWRSGHIGIVLTPAILDEYHRVGLELSRSFPSIDLGPILEMVALKSTIVQDSKLPEPVCSDSADDKFIAAAVVANAKYVISGDRALLKVRSYGDIPVVAPRTFVQICLKQA